MTAIAPSADSYRGGNGDGSVGIDLGKTHIRFYSVLSGHVVKKAVLVNSREPSESLEAVTQYLESYKKKQNLDLVGIGAYGTVDRQKGVILGSRSNPLWINIPIVDIVRSAVEIEQVALVNDATAAAVGLWDRLRFSGESLAYVVVGTGVGLGVARNGEPGGGSGALFGSIGAIPVVGERTLSEVCGGRGIVERYSQLRGDQHEVLTASEIFGRVGLGDANALKVFREAVDALAECLSWVAAVSDVDEIFVGGGVWTSSKEFRLEVSRSLQGLNGTRSDSIGRLPLRTTRSSWDGARGALKVAKNLVKG
ncbi:MAG: ROK family protein [Acidimicrobiales bacterium]|jgi:predicted NBD/HSP70 family sugar kinase